MAAPQNDDDVIDELRALPSVSVVLARPAVERAIARLGRAVVARAVRDVIGDARNAIAKGRPCAVSNALIMERAEAIARGTLRRVINATGIVVHTNLGRAPLAPEAIALTNEIAAGYTTLEYDLANGMRGERHGHARDLLVELTGAEDAVVVNNNAAAVLLMLAALAAGREVVVSRGELVEIGGGFRIPDVLAQSGARLLEVGTTNRTHAYDYENALSESTAMLLKVHRSNFAVIGFTAEVAVRDLAKIAHDRGTILACDAGAGCLVDELRGEDEPTVRALLDDGADLVAFSGDKLLGGPQAGIVVGRASLVARLRKHPLMRALRPDKLCLAALVGTLRLWRDDPKRVPVMRYATLEQATLRARADRIIAELDERFASVATIARFGGGSSPVREIPSWAVRVTQEEVMTIDVLAQRFRALDPPIIGHIEEDGFILDLRCVEPEDDARLLAALRAL